VTDRQDLLDPIMRKIGAALLVGDEVKTARLGQIETLMNQLKDEQRRLRNEATPIREGNE
jgi:hypothetical protein